MSSLLRNPAVNVASIALTRWRGAQHPTQQAVMQRMQAEGLKPYLTSYGPNARDGVRSHGYGKVLYCVEGSLEISLPDLRQTIVLKPGDRLELPRGTRHGVTVGLNGARCLEGAIRGTADNNRLTQEVKSI